MTDMESLGVALFLSAVLGLVGMLAILTYMESLAAPFLLFWMVGTVGLCMIAVGGYDEQ